MIQRLLELSWQYKWWWIPPFGLMVLGFLLLVFFSDVTGDAPFRYVVF
jgi:hypothetical protein